MDAADAAKWGRLAHWQPFLKDALNLALSLDKLGVGALAQARRVHEANTRQVPKSTPDNPDLLRVQAISPKPPKEPKKYAQVTSILQDAKEYEAVRVLDEHMGITQHTQTPGAVRRTFYEGMSFVNFSVKR